MSSALNDPAAVLAMAGAAATSALLVRAPALLPTVAEEDLAARVAEDWWLHRYRPILVLAIAAGAWVVVGGTVGIVAAGAVGAWCWRAIGRAESSATAGRRRAIAADLPVLVRLIATGLRAGLAPATATEMAARAFDGPASARLLDLIAPLGLGADPADVWRRITEEPGLGPLGVALLRAHDTGAAIGVVVDRLAVELARDARATTEDRARQVGVRAAIPLGVCLLPAFLELGIEPVVAGLAGALGL
jgi:Flp pilus assembly protein TadB